MTRLTALLVAWATPLMLAGVVVGFLVPPLAAAVRPVLTPLIVATLAVAVMRTDPATFAGALRRPLLPGLLVVWILAVSPLAMHLALLALGALGVTVGPALHGPLVLYAASAAITSMPAFALLYRLDATFVLIAVTGASLASPFSVPAVGALIMGEALPLSPTAMAGRLAAIVVTAYLAGFALRRLLGPARIAAIRAPLDAGFVIAATLIGVAVMDGALGLALARPGDAALTVAAVFAGTVALILAASALFWPAGLTTALGAGLASGPRSISTVLAALGAAASDELIMVVAAAQLPIFVLPLVQRPLIRWLTAR
ncbi:MAG: hypothetical protein VW644_10625 [Alphaproteobacteria bacterium]